MLTVAATVLMQMTSIGLPLGRDPPGNLGLGLGLTWGQSKVKVIVSVGMAHM